MIDLQALIGSAQQFEPLPASVGRLYAVTSKENCDLIDIEQVVTLDQSLTMRVLRAANSVASGSSMRIGTIREAVLRLGIPLLLSLATAAGVQKRMRPALPEYGLSEGALWRHSIAASLAAKLSGVFCRTSLPPEASAAALLHDVGKLVMARFLEPEVLRLLAAAREQGGLSSLRAEADLLQVHHGELGGLIAQRWLLPERIVTGITHHHTPDQARDIIADAVHLANIAAKRTGTDDSTNEEDLRLNPASMERLGITSEGFAALCEELSVQLDSALAMFN